MFGLSLKFLLFLGAFASADAIKIPCHSHNDYEQDIPLVSALLQGFQSVEADIWLSRGDIYISHWPWAYAGTLRELYLEPLSKRQATSPPVYLWLDIKDGRDDLRPKLAELLRSYSRVKNLKIILSGNDRSKKKMVEDYADLRIERDSNDYKSGDPQTDGVWTWYSLKWRKYFRWDGKTAIEPRELVEWRRMVESIHAKGKKVRFYDAPDTETYWRTAAEIGVDLIGTDNVAGLGEFSRRGFF